MKLARAAYVAGVTMISSFVASHLVRLIWKAVTRQPPPEDPKDLSIPTAAVVVFTTALAAATEIARVLGIRHAEKRWASEQSPRPTPDEA
jgi:hypothetical protein